MTIRKSCLNIRHLNWTRRTPLMTPPSCDRSVALSSRLALATSKLSRGFGVPAFEGALKRLG